MVKRFAFGRREGFYSLPSSFPLLLAPFSFLLALFSLLLSPFSLLLSTSTALAVEVDGVAAQVGSQTILKSDVYEEMRRGHMDPSMYNYARNELIDRKLILKAAQDSKMTMQEWVVENRIREIVQKSFDGDRNKLMDTLAKQRISYPEWRQKMKDDMIVGAMRWQIVDKNVDATPGDMREEYKRHPERYGEGGKVTVSVILLKPDDVAKRDEVSAAIRTNDFAEVAKKFSADSHASEGGVWKDIDPKDCFREEVCEEIAKMPKGTMSRWLELDGWSFLLRKDAETPAKKLSFADAYDQIDANVREQKAKKLYLDWIARLRAASYIKVY